jgi:hypothetical protein
MALTDKKNDSSKHFVFVHFKTTARADDAVLVMDDRYLSY